MLFVHEEWFWFFFDFLREAIEEVSFVVIFVEIADGLLISRVVSLEKASFVLPHAAGDLADRLVDAFIHVLGLTGGVDDNVVRAKENNFGFVATVAFDIEDGFSLNDFWVIKLESLDFAFGIFAE